MLKLDYLAKLAVEAELKTGQINAPQPNCSDTSSWVTAYRGKDGVLKLYREDF